MAEKPSSEVMDCLMDVSRRLDGLHERLDARDTKRKDAEGENKPAAKPPFEHKYNEESVNKGIAASNRRGQKIGGKEAKAIHGLLKGWRG